MLVLGLLGAAVWTAFHVTRLRRDAPLAAVCTDPQFIGRPEPELAAAFAPLGVVGTDTCSPCPGRRSYTVLVTPLQSFDCDVEVDATGTVRRAVVFRMTYVEATGFPGERWAPTWLRERATRLAAALTP
jgi:hypothetical protein